MDDEEKLAKSRCNIEQIKPRVNNKEDVAKNLILFEESNILINGMLSEIYSVPQSEVNFVLAREVNERGRMAWQKETNYGLRALVELAMLLFKTIIGPKLKSRELAQQKTEAEVSVRVLNLMTGLGMPVSVKVA